MACIDICRAKILDMVEKGFFLEDALRKVIVTMSEESRYPRYTPSSVQLKSRFDAGKPKEINLEYCEKVRRGTPSASKPP